MSDIGRILTALTFVYVLGMCLFLISENRRPQATLAWMLAFIIAPVIGVLLYVFFGREYKAFSKQRTLLKQQLKASARPLMSTVLSSQDENIARLENQSAQHRKLMMLVRHNSHSVLTMCRHVDIQQNATMFYPSLIQDMKAARHFIHLQYFIWRTDDFTAVLKEILVEKSRAGVEVRLLYDPVGSHAHLDQRYIDEMQAAGARMAPTSPFYRLHTISYRNHRKITVIDGEVGYTGGMNIGQEHLDGGEAYDCWRDTQVRIVGGGVTVLDAVFMVDWYNAVRENLFSHARFREDPTAPVDGSVPVQILASGPDSQWAAIRQLYFFMIVGAQHHVFLQSPYFVLDATIAEALKSAALSGVDVKVMLNATAAGEDRLPAWAGNTYIAEVAQAGVRVFLYNKGYLHAKTISIDSAICSIGSANIDIRSFSINYELNAVLYSERHAKELERDFERDLAYCTEFDIAEYQKSSAALRFRDSVARLFSPLL